MLPIDSEDAGQLFLERRVECARHDVCVPLRAAFDRWPPCSVAGADPGVTNRSRGFSKGVRVDGEDEPAHDRNQGPMRRLVVKNLSSLV